jgi:hypothetical protein
MYMYVGNWLMYLQEEDIGKCFIRSLH